LGFCCSITSGKAISAAAGVTWFNFYFRLCGICPTTIRSPQAIDFLGHLLRRLPGKLLVLWDGLRTHQAHVVRDFIAAQGGQLAVVWCPSYAPELNPVEYIY
jgi:hypothetical protein